MKTGFLEIGGVFLLGVATILGFHSSQSRQPYSLTQIQFCPKSINGQEGQEVLNKRYCHTARYVLTEEWKRYGKYGSIIPYKGQAVMKVADLPTDNPHQLLGNGISVLSLWGVTVCLRWRVHRLKKRDYLLGEAEKTQNYSVWQEQAAVREVKAYKTQLDKQLTIDRKSQFDVAFRKELGLTDDENERIRSQLNLEDYLKARSTQHTALDKQIAENLRDAAKARQEQQKYDKSKGEYDTSTAGVKGTPEARKKQMIQRLKDHEEGWLWELIQGKKPLWVIGEQGSGKSSFASSVALCRYGLLGMKLRLVVDAHGQKNINDAWKALSQVIPNFGEVLVGSYNNYEAIATAFVESIQLWAERMGISPKPEPVQSLYDEMTQLSIQPECQDAVKAFIRHSMSDTRGGRDRIICISHTFTNAATGDAAGFKELRYKSVMLVERFSEDGEVPKEVVTYRKGDEMREQTVPNWFKPATVLSELFAVN